MYSIIITGVTTVLIINSRCSVCILITFSTNVFNLVTSDTYCAVVGLTQIKEAQSTHDLLLYYREAVVRSMVVAF